jgi:arylsulfatase A-like enzyme
MQVHRSLAPVLILAFVFVGANPLDERQPATVDDRANIVVIVLDDMSANLLQYMNETMALVETSVVFDSFLVATPLCCPSRATIQTGKYPHNSRVRSNWWPVGGFGQFYAHDLHTSLGPYLDAAGYRTGLSGKLMNGYLPAGDHDGEDAPDYPRAYVPPGWDEWFVTGNGYGEFDYHVVVGRDGKAEIVRYVGDDASNYLTDVLASEAEAFIARASTGSEPFFLMVAPFAVHGAAPAGDPQAPDGYRFRAAPRDRADSPFRPVHWGNPEFPLGDCGEPVGGGCADVVFPDPINEGNFNIIPENPPRWAPTSPLSPAQIAVRKKLHIERIQMIQSVDDLVGRVLDALEVQGVGGRTYVMVTSDNGFHLGEHALGLGKSAAYDHDAMVPLVVHPPGGTEPTVVTELVQTTDLLPTFLKIAGAAIPADVDGRSVLDLVRGRASGRWRQGALVEWDDYTPPTGRLGPDRVTKGSASTYSALRTHDYLYVDYSKLDDVAPRKRGAELYDLRSDPHMIVNVWSTASPATRAGLNAELLSLKDCEGRQCWRRQLSVPSLD